MWSDVVKAAALAAAMAWAAPVQAHDIYTGLREGHRPTGPLCCGGDPITGDCEGFHEGEYEVTPDGGLILFSDRYKATVRVPADRVVDLPVADPEGRPVHWCGKPVDRDSDPARRDWITFCAFRYTGGT
jgi:hypothetical protein